MSPISPAVSPVGSHSAMSGNTENGANGFTAVNRPPLSPSESATRSIDPSLQSGSKEWKSGPAPHEDPPSNHGPYHVAPNKRRFAEMEGGRDEVSGIGPTPSTSPRASAAVTGAEEARQENGQAPVRNAPWPPEEDENSRAIATLLVQHDTPSQSRDRGARPNGVHQIPSDEFYGIDGRTITNAGLEVNMKNRKRAFTNRTKTGCQTCRRRKKKCDEAKPACNNCIRGGFTCLGYENKRNVNDKTPTSGKVSNILPRQQDERQYWNESPTGRYDAASMPAGLQERSGYDRGLGNWSSSPFPSTPRGLDNRSLPPLPGSGSAGTTIYAKPSNVVPRSVNQPMQTASSALSMMNPPEYASNVSGIDLATKGKYYSRPDDYMIAAERETCRMSCHRFNNAAFDGSSKEDLNKRFKAILQPDKKGSEASGPVPPVPQEFSVQAPFYAEYGYRIRLGNKVTIGSNCTMNDARDIVVGDCTRIGQNVLLTTEMDVMSSDQRWPAWRQAAQITIGASVIIRSGCKIAANGHDILIGDGTLIETGSVIACTGRPITIGQNCIIGPGCVVTTDLADGTRIVAPQPMVVQR